MIIYYEYSIKLRYWQKLALHMFCAKHMFKSYYYILYANYKNIKKKKKLQVILLYKYMVQ